MLSVVVISHCATCPRDWRYLFYTLQKKISVNAEFPLPRVKHVLQSSRCLFGLSWFVFFLRKLLFSTVSLSPPTNLEKEIMSNEIIQPSTAAKQITLKDSGYNPSLGPIQIPYSYQSSTTNQRKSIYDQSLSRRAPEINLSSLSFLFCGLVEYAHSQSKGIRQLESRLNASGYSVGTKVLELITFRDGKNAKRGTKIVEMLQFIHTQVWRTLFGKVADELEKSQDSEDEYMITDNLPLVSQFISVPKEFSQLNVSAFIAGIIEGILDSAYFQAEVSAHTMETKGYPLRTVFLIKFDHGVTEREKLRFGK